MPSRLLCAMFASVLLLVSGLLVCRGFEGEDYSKELPRIPPKSPTEALSTFVVEPGFKIEQAAAEPLVHSPVAMSFDENGRMYVVEMIDYSEQDKERLGSVRLLEDTDGDGTFEKGTLFVDGLSWPTAITCWDGGVFVGAAPELWYFKDTDGDGKADIKNLVYVGFSRQNVQGLINSFQWGLDNRIHAAVSTSGATITRPDVADFKPIALNGRDMALEPRTLGITATSGGAQHGMSFDDWGNKFVCSNSDHIQQVMFEDRYVARNKYLPAPSPRVSIAKDGPQAEVYRISPVEPWRIVRTRLRVSKKVPGVVEGGGRAAGYFTGATGTTIYRGDAWPEEYRGQAFVGDVGSNIVHRKTVDRSGLVFVADRATPMKEFVASTDTWFRPAQYSNSPDGNLYMCDVYREVIEHPASLPPDIKKHLDLTSGRDRGRIYRVVRDGAPYRKSPKLGEATTAELVATLGHRNGWHRDTASRLLYTRQDMSAVGALIELAATCELPEGRMHAMYALQGLGALTPATILKALGDKHPGVRRHAVRLAETVADNSPAVRTAMAGLADDPDIHVKYQLAFSLGELSPSTRVLPLAQLLTHSGGDRWMKLAALTSLDEGAADVLKLLSVDEPFRKSPAGQEILQTLANLVGLEARAGDFVIAMQALEPLSRDDAALAGTLVRSLSEGLAKSNSPLRERLTGGTIAGKVLDDLLTAARAASADDKLPAAARVDAIRTLGLGTFAKDGEALAAFLDNKQPQDVQLAAIGSLGRFDDAGVAGLVLEAWSGFSPRIRSAAADLLFSRPAWIVSVLDAIEAGKVPLGELDPTRLKLLAQYPDKAVQSKAVKVLETLKVGRRADVLEAYKPVLTMKGDVDRGRLAFRKICSVCHKLEGQGFEIGPNLATLQNRGAEAILVNVIDPNREVNPQFVNYVALTNAGKQVTGLIAGETATSVTLKRQENQSDTILRIDIDVLKSTGLSIMPEGMEKQIDQQTMADIIEYLLSIK